jgi:hypothetical protein
MFNKKFDERLIIWRNFRDDLEHSLDPIQDTINFYTEFPNCSIGTDPYTPSTWPDPWKLLEENNYCSFVKILAICYTLQLTDVLSSATYEIHITRDNKNSETYYLLYVDDNVIGFTGDAYVQRKDLPDTLRSELVHTMSPLQ